jgi:hypothetical protein
VLLSATSPIGVSGGAGADALRRGWIGLTMKPLIGYGSDVSASRPARLVGDKTSTWTYKSPTRGSACDRRLADDHSRVVAQRLPTPVFKCPRDAELLA